MPKLEQKLSITDMVYFANFIQHVDALRRKNMIDSPNWQQIIKTISTAQRASMHCSIATVDQLGQPNITPIGTVFLKNNQTGFFFDTYSESFKENIPNNSKACLQAVNIKRFFWLKSMILGKFSDFPGVRLNIEISELRIATAEELAMIEQRIKPLSWTKGSQLIWSSFTHVRDFNVTGFKWVQYPTMMPNYEF